MNFKKYTRIYLLIIFTFICVGYSYAAQNPTVLLYLTNLRSTDSGQVGYILGEIFNTSGKIKQDYLDLTGLGGTATIDTATTSVTGIVMLEHSTGSTLQTKAPTSGIIKLMWDYFVANKQDKVIGGATTIMTGDLVASRVLVSDTNGKVGASTVTSAELWYLTGVTSNVQSQLNGKAPLASPALSGTPTAPTAAVGTNNTQIATTAFVKSQGYITAASLTGVSSVNSRTGAVTLTSSDVGLGNVNNTSDLNKPISTATQTALNGKVTSNVAIIAGTYPKITYDAKGLVTGGSALLATDIPNLDWSKITTGKPTTLVGYGITDAASDSETVKLTGNQTIAGIKTFSDRPVLSRLGVAGTYNASQVQQIWSIGSAYGIDTTLNDFGNNYGLVYSHTNAGSGTISSSIPNWGHQIAFTDNGNRNAVISLTTGNAYFAGNVGIGTTTPVNTLEISKDQNENTAVGVFNRHATATGATAYLYAGNDKSGISIGVMGSANTNTGFGSPGDSFIYNSRGTAVGKNLNIINNQSGKIQFYTDSTAAGAERMVIDNLGNVGIGTSTPGAKLDINPTNVEATVLATALSTVPSSNQILISYGPGDGLTSSWLMREKYATSNWGIFHDNLQNAFHFVGSNTSRLAIDLDGGNIGIGTPTPTNKFTLTAMGDVTGADAGGGMLLQDNDIVGSGSKLRFDVNELQAATNGVASTYAINPFGGDIRFGMSGTGVMIKSSGYVGIGINTPTSLLHLDGPDGSQIRVNRLGVISALLGDLGATNNGQLNLYDAAGAIGAVITSGGTSYMLGGGLGIGTTNPGTYKLYVNGTGYLGAAAWVYSSDRRLKENISSLSYGLEDIMKLKTKKFDYIKGEKNNFGFIAQDVQKIFPEIVNTQPNGMLGLKTDMIVPVLVNAVQELKKEKDSMKNETLLKAIKEQQQKIETLEMRIANLENK